MIKASSLLYAVFVCFIVAILCSGLILVSNAHQKLSTLSHMERQLIDDCESAFQYALVAMPESDYQEEIMCVPYEGAVPTIIRKKKWGMYDIISCKTVFKNDTLVKNALVGKRGKKERLALFLADHDRPLNMVGTAKITGDVKMSKYGMKRAYIQNRRGSTGAFHKGEQTRSGKVLPKLDESLLKTNLAFNSKILGIGDILENKRVVNTFQNPEIVIKLNQAEHLSEVVLKGNIVLTSRQKITIGANAQLEDIIIKAPEVVFEKGFTGAVQVFATQKVVLEEEVQLQYPSSLYVKINPGEQENVAELKKGSMIIGGVVVLGDNHILTRNRVLFVAEGAHIVGDVYNMGATELRGKITGTLFTDKFVLNTLGSIYDNHMMDSEITSKELPESFVGVPLFKNKTEDRYALIKEL